MDSKTFDKLNYILSGYQLTMEDRDALIDLMEEYRLTPDPVTRKKGTSLFDQASALITPEIEKEVDEEIRQIDADYASVKENVPTLGFDRDVAELAVEFPFTIHEVNAVYNKLFAPFGKDHTLTLRATRQVLEKALSNGIHPLNELLYPKDISNRILPDSPLSSAHSFTEGSDLKPQ